MSRKKTKEPCWFCDTEHFDKDEAKGIQLTAEVYPDNELIGVIVSGNAEGGDFVELNMNIEMHYCPVCGRKCGY